LGVFSADMFDQRVTVGGIGGPFGAPDQRAAEAFDILAVFLEIAVHGRERVAEEGLVLFGRDVFERNAARIEDRRVIGGRRIGIDIAAQEAGGRLAAVT